MSKRLRDPKNGRMVPDDTPGYSITESFRVRIHNDRELCQEFLQFLIESGRSDADYIWDLRGGSSGLGNMVRDFPIEFKDRIEAWFAATPARRLECGNP